MPDDRKDKFVVSSGLVIEKRRKPAPDQGGDRDVPATDQPDRRRA